MMTKTPDLPSERITQLLAVYDVPNASAAHLLCDIWPEEALAYRIVCLDVAMQDLTYGELKLESERFAAALSDLGVKAGDRVATLMGKSREYLIALMGIWRLGAVHVPLFTAFAPPAIAFRLESSNARLVICDTAQQDKLTSPDMPENPAWRVISTSSQHCVGLNFHELLSAQSPGFPAARLGGAAPIINIFTSGTTGSPKSVVVPLRAVAAFRAYAEFGLDLRADDLYWCAADPGWAYGLYFGILGSFSTGTPSLLVQGGFVPDLTLSILARHRVTNFTAAPTIYRALREVTLPSRPSFSLRRASSAGEPLTPDVNVWAADMLGVPVHDHYGQTEAGMLINNHHHPDLSMPIKAGSMGRVMPGWRAVVLDEKQDTVVEPGVVGRLAMDLADSPLAWFAGYEGNAAKSAEKFTSDGRWYLTGDIARIDAEGYTYFSARDDDVIIMAGYRIGPHDVESTLCRHPAVLESAVIATPDAIRGEVLEAFVVLKSGYAASNELARELQRWVKERYAAHAYPRLVHFIEELPKTPSGKIQRFVLKQQRCNELSIGSAKTA